MFDLIIHLALTNRLKKYKERFVKKVKERVYQDAVG